MILVLVWGERAYGQYGDDPWADCPSLLTRSITEPMDPSRPFEVSSPSPVFAPSRSLGETLPWLQSARAARRCALRTRLQRHTTERRLQCLFFSASANSNWTAGAPARAKARGRRATRGGGFGDGNYWLRDGRSRTGAAVPTRPGSDGTGRPSQRWGSGWWINGLESRSVRPKYRHNNFKAAGGMHRRKSRLSRTITRRKIRHMSYDVIYHERSSVMSSCKFQ
jgi:hypothetical protein